MKNKILIETIAAILILTAPLTTAISSSKTTYCLSKNVTTEFEILEPSKTILSNEEKWTKTFGGRLTNEIGHCVEQTSDGGYIIIGGNEVGKTGTNGIWLIKLKSDGTREWVKKYPGGQGHCVKQTEDGGYILVSNYFNSISLMKTDANGEVEWSKIFNGLLWQYHAGDNIVQQTSDGGYIITAMTDPYEFGFYDISLIKTDENGAEEWHKTYGKYNYRGCSVQKTADGGFILLGDTANVHVSGKYGLVLIKADSNGSEEWNKTVYASSTWFTWGCLAQQTSDGGYVVFGYRGDYGGFIIKTDSNGNEEWHNLSIGELGYNEFYSAQQTSDGGYIITGGHMSLLPPGQLLLIKLNGAGEVEWNKKYGCEGGNRDIGMSVKETSDGGYIIAGVKGIFRFYFLFNDIYVIKTDANGDTSAISNQQISQQQSQQSTLTSQQASLKINQFLQTIMKTTTV